MAEYRVPTTTKVEELIAAHTDLLEEHGVSAGVAASRPAASAAGNYYFATDTKVWSRDNGTTWDEIEGGLGEVAVQALIDASLATHTGNADAHHTAFVATDASDLITTHASDPSAHHAAPTYDEINGEVVFQI